MKSIDFSCKHDVLLMHESGALLPMDVPYFEPLLVAPNTWRVYTSGDYSYLVAGDEEAIVIDSGYGCGNLREFCQSLVDVPVRRIMNTHDHFDHTANNCYFDVALMSKETAERATIPFKSFEGIDFPRDYPKKIIDEGYIVHLGNRDLETFFIPDHAPGSLAWLDRKGRILFSGDEIMMIGCNVSGTVERRERQYAKLAEHRSEFDTICGGYNIFPAEQLDRFLENLRYILDGHEGEPAPPRGNRFPPVDDPEGLGRTIYRRKDPRPTDTKPRDTSDQQYKRMMEYAGVRVTYDIRRVWDSK